MADLCKSTLNSYIKFLGALFEVSATEEGCLILTPFQFSDGQPIAIELIQQPDNRIKISDSGDTVNYLFLNGLNIARRGIKQEFARIAFQRGVQIEKEEIFTMSQLESLAQNFHKVLMAVQDVAYLIYKREFRGPATFEDEVEKFLISNQISYFSRYELEVRARKYTFQFYIDENKNALIQPLTATTPNSALSKAERLAYRWIKIREFEPKYKKITVVDDIGRKQEIWIGRPGAILQEDSDYFIRWSTREELLATIS